MSEDFGLETVEEADIGTIDSVTAEDVETSTKLPSDPVRLMGLISLLTEQIPRLKEGLIKKAEKIQSLEARQAAAKERLEALKAEAGGDLSKIAEGIIAQRQKEIEDLRKEFGLD